MWDPLASSFLQHVGHQIAHLFFFMMRLPRGFARLSPVASNPERPLSFPHVDRSLLHLFLSWGRRHEAKPLNNQCFGQEYADIATISNVLAKNMSISQQ